MKVENENKETARMLPSNDEKMKKIKIDIAVFQEQFKDLVVDSEQGIREAESIQKQAKALKGLAKAATDLEWKTKKDVYDKSRVETEKAKKEYYEIRDVRKSLMDACANIFSGAKKKIEDFKAECIRMAELEKARLAKELRDKEEAERREEEAKAEDAEKVNQKVKEVIDVLEKEPKCKHGKTVNETCKECGRWGEIEENHNITNDKQVNETMSSPTELTNKTTEPDAITPQKPEEEQNEPIKEEISELDKLNSNAWDAICGDVEGFEVIERKVVDKWRHGTVETAIVRSKNSGKSYQSNFRDSCKDMSFEDMNGESSNFFELKKEIEIEVTNIKQLIGSIMRGERGATFDLIQPNTEELIKLAKKNDCKPGDTIITGCRVKG
jgi:hypothetical protein